MGSHTLLFSLITSEEKTTKWDKIYILSQWSHGVYSLKKEEGEKPEIQFYQNQKSEIQLYQNGEKPEIQF